MSCKQVLLLMMMVMLVLEEVGTCLVMTLTAVVVVGITIWVVATLVVKEGKMHLLLLLGRFLAVLLLLVLLVRVLVAVQVLRGVGGLLGVLTRCLLRQQKQQQLRVQVLVVVQLQEGQRRGWRALLHKLVLARRGGGWGG
jgi:hypothetical protein